MKTKVLQAPIIAFLVILIATESLFTGLKIGFLDIHRALEILIFIVLLPIFYRDIQRNKLLSYMAFVFIVFGLLLSAKTFFILTLDGELDTTWFVETIRLGLAFMYLYLVYYTISTKPGALVWVLWINVLVFLVAFFQFQPFPFSDFFWDLKLNYFSHNSPDTKIEYVDKTRIVGLYAYAIPMVYALVNALIVAAYLFLTNKRSVYLVIFLFLGVVGVLSLTRSYLITFGVMSMYMLYLIGRRTTLKVRMFLVVFLLTIGFGFTSVYLEQTESIGRLTSSDDASYTSRVPLALTGLYTVSLHPLGASPEQIQSAKEDMFASLHHPAILKYPSHVGLLELGIKFTLFGVFFFLFFIWYLQKKYMRVLSREKRIFFTVAFIAYMGNAMFHNMFILTGDYYILTVIALLLYEYNLVRSEALHA